MLRPEELVFGPISPDSFQLLLYVAEGVAHCHGQDVVHGDLHCGNVLLERVVHANGDVELRAVLADFGKSVDYADQHQQVYIDEKPLKDAKVSRN